MQKVISFINRTWSQLQNAHKRLLTRYKKVSLKFFYLKNGFYKGCFLVGRGVV